MDREQTIPNLPDHLWDIVVFDFRFQYMSVQRTPNQSGDSDKLQIMKVDSKTPSLRPPEIESLFLDKTDERLGNAELVVG